MALALTGAPEGTLVLASGQTSGRGRVGRSWHSPAGGLYASIVLRPLAQPGAWPALSVLAGTAVAQALHAAGVTEVRVKWPNDIVVAGRKIAGLLAEARVDEGFVVLGLGLNVAFSDELPGAISDVATCLAAHLPVDANPMETCEHVLVSVVNACANTSIDLSVDPVSASRWLDCSRDVLVDGLRGRPVGITELGELELDVPGGTRVRVSVGEVNDAGSN
jgi:BirA family biotin operon repressor/biotin-[acetyl-CoA-carboxylase] ligase